MVLSRNQMGKNIKMARAIKSKATGSNYTQEQLANDIGVSRSYLGDFESGRKYPNYVLMQKIAEACGVSIELIVGEENNVDQLHSKRVVDALIVSEPVVQYNSQNASAFLNNEGLTEDEYVALKSFLEVYRRQKKGE